VARTDAARALAEDIGAGDLTAALIPADRTSHARLLFRTELALHEVENTEDLDRADIDREVTAPESAVLARERVYIRCGAQSCVMPAARVLVGRDRAELLDFCPRQRGFLGDDSAHQSFVDRDFQRYAPQRPLHEAAAQRVPRPRARRRILHLFGFPGDFSLDARSAAPETCAGVARWEKTYECASAG